MPSAAYDADRAHVFHSWSAQATLDPVVIAGGSGSWFWDESGRRWLDFSSQLINLNVGHQHPAVVAAVQEQAAQLCTVAPQFANAARSELARRLAALAPGDLDMVFFTNGGADANEHAVRLARLATGRTKVLAAYRSYHGGTAGAIALTGDPRRWASEPGSPAVVHFFGPYLYRTVFHAQDEAQECARALQHLEDVLTMEGAHTVAAIVLEPVVGANGILVPPPGYLAGVRALCDRFGILLVCDEVMTGFARCGEWFAVDRWGVAPDLLTFAKGVNSGYVPLGGVLISRRVADAFAHRPYPGGLTYSGHPLACAAALATLDVYQDEGVIAHVRRMADQVVGPGLRALQERHPSVGEVRGLGMFWAVELVRDRETREPLVPFNATGADAAPMAAVASACRDAGLWPFTNSNRLHVAPPCTTSAADLAHGLELLDAALDTADTYCRNLQPVG